MSIREMNADEFHREQLRVLCDEIAELSYKLAPGTKTTATLHYSGVTSITITIEKANKS